MFVSNITAVRTVAFHSFLVSGAFSVFQEKQRQNMLGVTSEQRNLFASQQMNQFQGKGEVACFKEPEPRI